jgi:hypothetical protein
MRHRHPMPFDYAVPSVPDGSRIDYSDRLLVAHRLVLQKNLPALIQGKRFGKSARLAQELAHSATDPEDRAGWEKLATDFGRRSIRQRVWCGVVAAGVIGIIVSASISDDSATRSRRSARSSTGASTAYVPSDQQSLSMPAKGGEIMTGPELRWCLLEVDRLKRIRQLAGEAPSSTVADAWNSRHDDWKSRCATKHYPQSAAASAERLVQTSAASTQAEALSIYTSWSQPQKPSYVPAAPLKPSLPSTGSLIPGKTRWQQ